MVKVLDAYAIMAYLQKKPGHAAVKDLFVKAAADGTNLLMSVVNWGEVYYILTREYGQKEAEHINDFLQTLPINFVPVDMDTAKQAALLKAAGKISYADSFAAALAKIHNGSLVTGDREFKTLEKEIDIVWLVS
jgi:ribonuclease VapC